MADYDYLKVSDGTGDAALMHITAPRSVGATVITVDTVSGVPTKFIGTYGTLLSTGLIDPTTKRDFKGHVSTGTLIIDAFEPGSTDSANIIGQVVIIKPNTGLMNRIATFIMNMTGFGTPENITTATLTSTAITATSLATSADATVGGNAHVTGNIDITGTSRLVPVTVTTADGSFNLTPTKQIFGVTALAHDATVLVPTYSAYDGMVGEIQILDNGTARALTWPAGWVAIGVTLPTATVAGKYLYVSYRYNAADSKWHVRGIARQS